MKPKKRQWLTKEQKDTAAASIREYMQENFDVQISNMQAQFFVDFLCETVGSDCYNCAVEDAIHLMNDKVSDLYLLIQQR